MPADITPFNDDQAPLPGLTSGAELYNSLPRWSGARYADNRAAAEHALDIRAEIRDVKLARIRIAAQLAKDLAQMEADDRRLLEVKLQIERRRRMSQALTGDDPELRAMLAVLDDDAFGAQRKQELRRRQS